MDSERTLHSVPDDELLRRLGELVSHSRRVEADLVSHIGEVEERRLFAREAFPSMYAYCTGVLHLSEAEAFLRIAVARAARQHPQLLTMLGDGRLHLSGIVKLAPLLTRENRDGLLKRATHLSKRQILQLVAELSPRPDVPSVMRKLPQPRHLNALRVTLEPHWAAGGVLELGPDAVGASIAPGSLELGPGGVQASPTPADASGSGETPHPSGSENILSASRLAAPFVPPTAPHLDDRVAGDGPSRPAVVEPLSPERYKVQFTASAQLHDKLERLQALMRSEILGGDLAAIIEAAVTEKLERIEARRYAKTRAPRTELSSTDTSPTSRHVPAAVRRAVRERDGNRCGYVDERGRRCSERDRLEFHHRHPFGMGGDHSPANLRLLCASHNRHLAEFDYGQAAIRGRSVKATSASPAPGLPG